MMLDCLPLILAHESPLILDFFEANVFQTPQMEIELFVPWREGMEEHTFASHTSLISKELLVEKLSAAGVPCEAPTKSSRAAVDAEAQSATRASERQEIAKFKRKLRPMTLAVGAGASDEGGAELKRVQVEALDLDWVFDGDNANRLLECLAEGANSAVLTKRSVRIFIALMWREYQNAIICYIFLPYIVYLYALSALSGRVLGTFIDGL